MAAVLAFAAIALTTAVPPQNLPTVTLTVDAADGSTEEITFPPLSPVHPIADRYCASRSRHRDPKTCMLEIINARNNVLYERARALHDAGDYAGAAHAAAEDVLPLQPYLDDAATARAHEYMGTAFAHAAFAGGAAAPPDEAALVSLLDAARASFRAAIASDPTYARAYCNEGKLLYLASGPRASAQGDAEQHAEALALMQRAAALGSAECAGTVADRLVEDGRVDEARAAYRSLAAGASAAGDRSRALALAIKRATALPPLLASRADLLTRRARCEHELFDLAAQAPALPRLADPLLADGSHLYFSVYHGFDERPLREALARVHRAASPSLSYVAPHVVARPRPRPGAPLRVGFASAHLRSHSVGKLLCGVVRRLGLRAHAFDVAAIFLGHAAGAAGDQGPCDFGDAPGVRSVHVSSRLSPAVYEAIAALKLDVLVYGDVGLLTITYFLGFARLAPVQMAFWGHGVTTGMSTIDYFVLSKAMLPKATARRVALAAEGPPICASRNLRPHARPSERFDAFYEFTESVLCFDGITTYFEPPPAPTPADEAEAAAVLFHLVGDRWPTRDGFHYFAMPQYSSKHHPRMDPVLFKLLRRDSRAVVLLSAGRGGADGATWTLLHGRLEASFAALLGGNDREAAALAARVVALPFVRLPVLVALASRCAAVLDTFPSGSGVLALELLSAGVPVVALPARTHLLLVSMLYEQLGFPRGAADDAGFLSAADEEGYVALAVRLGTDAAFRAACVRRIKDANAAAATTLYRRDDAVDEWARVLLQVAQQNGETQIDGSR